MTAPVERVYLGLGSTWKTADGSITWTEVPVVMKRPSRSVRRGRSNELDEDRAGSYSANLRNTDRRFDPLNSSGPYFGFLVPGVPIKVTATPQGGSELPVFRGFVDSWTQESDRDKVAICAVRASDGFAKLATAGLPSSVYAAEVAADAPDVWYRLAEDAGVVMGDSAGEMDGTYDDGATFFSHSHPNRWDSESGLSFPPFASAGLSWEASAIVTDPDLYAPPLTISFLAQVKDDETSIGLFQLAAFDLPDGAGFLTGWRALIGRTGAIGVTDPYFAFSQTSASADDAQTTAILDMTAPHHYAVRYVDATTIVLYIDGTVATSGAASLGSYAVADELLHWGAFGVTVADVALWTSDIGAGAIADQADAFLLPWNDDTSGARLGRILDLAGWPADLRDIETGDSILGPAVLDGKALSVAKDIEAAELGRLFVTRDGKVRLLNRYFFATETTSTTSQATFSDDLAGIRYSGFAFDLDASLVLNRIRARRPGGALIEVFDQASIDAYGEQVDDRLVGVAFGSDAGATDAANHRLAQYKDPRQRARPIKVGLHTLNPTQQAVLLGLELGYRVTIRRNGVNTSALVEAISHEIGETNEWWVTITTAPADAYAVGILDDDTPSTALARLDTSGSTLASGVDSDDTSLSVATTSGPLWTTDSAYVPFNITVGAEEMTVTAVSGGSSPQTFTVTRSVNGVVQSHSSSDPVALANPFVLAF